VSLRPEPEPTTITTAQYLTPAQVAEMLQVSEKSISRWALSVASMPVLRIGRIVRFERQALLAWLARKQPRASRVTAEGRRP